MKKWIGLFMNILQIFRGFAMAEGDGKKLCDMTGMTL